VELYLHSHNTPSWRGTQLKKSTGTTLPLCITMGAGLIMHYSLLENEYCATCKSRFDLSHRFCYVKEESWPTCWASWSVASSVIVVDSSSNVWVLAKVKVDKALGKK
jgi:hypothetical protein